MALHIPSVQSKDSTYQSQNETASQSHEELKVFFRVFHETIVKKPVRKKVEVRPINMDFLQYTSQKCSTSTICNGVMFLYNNRE